MPLAFGLALAGTAHAQLVVTGVPDSPDPVAAGGTVTYTVGIGDAPGAPRSNVTLNFDIPAGGRYDSVEQRGVVLTTGICK